MERAEQAASVSSQLVSQAQSPSGTLPLSPNKLGSVFGLADQVSQCALEQAQVPSVSGILSPGPLRRGGWCLGAVTCEKTWRRVGGWFCIVGAVREESLALWMLYAILVIKFPDCGSVSQILLKTHQG